LATVPHESEVSLVDQCSRLERVPGILLGHPRGGELPQLVVDEREQLGRGLGVAGRGRVQESGDVGHAAQHIASAP
jgi:hypothetical protein